MHGHQILCAIGCRRLFGLDRVQKGTSTPDSDWDVAFLVDLAEVKHVTSHQCYWPENPFRNYRNVNACVLTPSYLKTDMYDFGQISHQIARYGEPLLGELEVDREFLDKMTRSRPDDWDRHLNESYPKFELLRYRGAALQVKRRRKTASFNWEQTGYDGTTRSRASC